MSAAEKKHTPGPWVIDGPKPMDIRCRVHRIVNADLFPAAFVPAWDAPGPGEVDGAEEAIANARLIAAAPDLLAVLKEIVANSMLVHGSEWWGRVHAAIAKAEPST